MSGHSMVRYLNGVLIKFGTSKSIFLGEDKKRGGVKIVFKRRLYASERDKEFNQLGHWKTKSYKFCQVNLTDEAFGILFQLGAMKLGNVPDPPVGTFRKLEVVIKAFTVKN